jgi:hypothetical protein
MLSVPCDGRAVYIRAPELSPVGFVEEVPQGSPCTAPEIENPLSAPAPVVRKQPLKLRPSGAANSRNSASST